MRYIDLRSDTVTHPTAAMRQAMACAEVGDDVYQDDPVTNELEALGARLLGKEAALFVPSGTMGNQLGIMSQTRRGDEILVGEDSHIFTHEVGAASVLSGVVMHPICYPDAMPQVEMAAAAVHTDDIHEAPTTMLCLENALANGRVVPLERMQEMYAFAKSRGLTVHLDGARVFNAATALGVDVKEITACCDTVSCCLSKGLCAPIGSLLAGPAAVIARARKFRKMLGGGMRQTGILASAAILALTEMPVRLKEDHENARYMAEKLAQLPGVTVAMDRVEINMVWFRLDLPLERQNQLQAQLLQQGIKVNGLMGDEMRWMTNNDVTRADIDIAVAALAQLIR